MPRARYIEHNGQRKSIRQWSDELGLPMRRIHARLQSGWPEDDALRTDLGPCQTLKHLLLLEIGGETKSSFEWSQVSGIPEPTIRSRYKAMGWPAWDAAFLPMGTRDQDRHPGKRYTHDGVTLNLTQWAERLGVQRQVVRYRIENLGWPLERALTQGRDPKGRGRPPGSFPVKQITYMGRSQSAREWSIELDNGLTPTHIASRVRNGWSVERAMTTPPVLRGQYIRKKKPSG